MFCNHFQLKNIQYHHRRKTIRTITKFGYFFKNRSKTAAESPNIYRLLMIISIISIQLLFDQVNAELNIDEVNNIYYDVQLTDEPYGFLQQNDEQIVPVINTDDSVLIVANDFGQRFICEIPNVTILLDEQRELETAMTENLTTRLVADIVAAPFYVSPCLRKTFGWWTYELCYEKEIQQYHLEGRAMVGNVVSLGHFINNASVSENKGKKGSTTKQMYFAQIYNDGTLCELTGKLRKTEVRYYCDNELSTSEAYIDVVDETSSCSYLITVQVGSLCSLNQFRPVDRPTTNHESINCRPLLDNDEMVDYRREWNRERSLELARIEEKRLKDEAELIRRQRTARQTAAAMRDREIVKENEIDQLMKQYRILLESVLKKRAIDRGENADSVQLFDFDFKLFENNDDDDDEQYETDEDRQKMEIWYYFHNKYWDKRDFPMSLSKGLQVDVDIDDDDDDNFADLTDLFNRELIASGASGGNTADQVESNPIDEILKQIDQIAHNVDEMSKQLKSMSSNGESAEKQTQSSIEETVESRAERSAAASTEKLVELVASDEDSYAAPSSTETNSQSSSDIQQINNVDLSREKMGKKIEAQLSEKLKNAGFDPKGQKVEVRVISSGYFDEDGQYHMFGTKDSAEFADIIVSMLGFNDGQQQKEQKQHIDMETNYAFRYRRNQRVL